MVADRKVEGRPFVRVAFGPNTTAVSANNPIDGGKADAATFELAFGMKAVKGSEQFLGLLHVEADTIVTDENRLFTINGGLAHLNPRNAPVTGRSNGFAKRLDQW